MKVDCQIPVNASKEAIWAVISDYEHMVENIQAITKVEILERPTSSDSLVGLKWTETRTMFGSEATETMWVTESVTNQYYQTRAENCGTIYHSRVFLAEENGQNYVGMSFEGEAQSFCSKVMMVAMGWMMVDGMKKALLKDLEDIKNIAEGNKPDPSVTEAESKP
jgi:hypothetical protein